MSFLPINSLTDRVHETKRMKTIFVRIATVMERDFIVATERGPDLNHFIFQVESQSPLLINSVN